MVREYIVTGVKEESKTNRDRSIRWSRTVESIGGMAEVNDWVVNWSPEGVRAVNKEIDE